MIDLCLDSNFIQHSALANSLCWSFQLCTLKKETWMIYLQVEEMLKVDSCLEHILLQDKWMSRWNERRD